jgi:hypothetical protein
MLTGLLNHPTFLSWVNVVKQEKLNKWGDLTQAKLCGVDFNFKETTFKFYLELKSFPSISLLENFFFKNVAEEIASYEPYWDPTKCSGLGLGFKINTKGTYRNYFHIKFNSLYKDMLYSNKFAFLKILGIDTKNLDRGISFEVPNNQEAYKKFYLYIRTPQEIKKVLASKNITTDLDISKIEELELYASPNTSKINIINNNDFYKISQSLWDTVPKCYEDQVKECEAQLQSPLLYTGFTADGTFSCYFSLTNIFPNIVNL